MNAPRKILLTTSRNPTPRIRTFCNDLARVIPIIVRVNRGKMSMDEVAEEALAQGTDKVVIVDRWQGGPSKIKFFHISKLGLVHVSPMLCVAGIRLQREFAPIKLKPIHSLVITQSFENSMKTAHSLSEFFGFPVLSEKDVLSEHSITMRISHDAKGRVQITFMLLPQKVEIGPRITLGQIRGKLLNEGSSKYPPQVSVKRAVRIDFQGFGA